MKQISNKRAQAKSATGYGECWLVKPETRLPLQKFGKRSAGAALPKTIIKIVQTFNRHHMALYGVR